MSKGQKTRNDDKKKPAKTLKEKRQAKKDKAGKPGNSGISEI